MAKSLGGEGGAVGGVGQMNAMNRQAMDQAARPAAPGVAQQWGNTSVAQYESGQQEQVANVQNVGNRAFYRRGQQWVDGQLTGKDLAKVTKDAQEIKQFSDDYFRLVAANNTAENQILAVQKPGEELVVELRSQVYRILPATN